MTQLNKFTKAQTGDAGFSIVEMLAVVLLIIIIINLTIKIAPIYMSNYLVEKSLDELSQQIGLYDKTPEEVENLLEGYFDANQITFIEPEDIKIEKTPASMKVSIAYDIRKPLFGNVSLVVNFNDSIEAKPLR